MVFSTRNEIIRKIPFVSDLDNLQLYTPVLEVGAPVLQHDVHRVAVLLAYPVHLALAERYPHPEIVVHPPRLPVSITLH